MEGSIRHNLNVKLQSICGSQVSVKEGIPSGVSVRPQTWSELISVFEVISAKEGRRLYQATSEHDLKVGLPVESADDRCGYTQ